MTTETEKKFFKAFGIEPKRNQQTTSGLSGIPLPDLYPEITDRILLELIKLALKVRNYTYVLSQIDIKEQVLNDFLRCSGCSYYEVRKLFGEKEQTDEK